MMNRFADQSSVKGTIKIVALVLLCQAAAVKGEAPQRAAKELSRQLANEVSSAGTSDRVDDEAFLRRVFFDLVGEPPTPDDVAAFLLSKDGDKRRKIVRRLLEDEGYAKNWARYWRDVIMFRRSEERALLASSPLTGFLEKALAENQSWDKIATDLITAKGDVRENGATGLIMAQSGRPEDTVSEISGY